MNYTGAGWENLETVAHEDLYTQKLLPGSVSRETGVKFGVEVFRFQLGWIFSGIQSTFTVFFHASEQHSVFYINC